MAEPSEYPWRINLIVNTGVFNAAGFSGGHEFIQLRIHKGTAWLNVTSAWTCESEPLCHLQLDAQAPNRDSIDPYRARGDGPLVLSIPQPHPGVARGHAPRLRQGAGSDP